MKHVRSITVMATVAACLFALAACGGVGSTFESVQPDSGSEQEPWWGAAGDLDGDQDTSYVADDSEGDEGEPLPSDDSGVMMNLNGPEELTKKTGESFSQLFYVGTDAPDHEFEWDVTGKPDWIEAAPNAVNSKLFTLSSDLVPGDAAGQSFAMTITASDTQSTASASAEFVFIVKPIEMIKISMPPDPCSEPLAMTTDFNSALTAVLGEDAAPVKINIQGKPPFRIYWTSRVDKSRHCRTKWTSYYDDGSYRFTSSGGCGEDEVADPIWTRNTTWEIEDADGTPIFNPQNDMEVIGVETMKNQVTLTGRNIYNGPLPMSLLPKMPDGGDDLNKYPLERLSVTVYDSCAATQEPVEDGMLTVTRFALAQMQRFINHPANVGVGLSDIKASVKYSDADIYSSGARLKIYYGPETFFYFNYDEHAVARTTFDISQFPACTYSECIRSAETTEFSGCNINIKNGTSSSNYKPLYIKAFFEGVNPHVSSGAGCGHPNDADCIKDDLDIKYIRFDTPYWRAQWRDVHNEFDEDFSTDYMLEEALSTDDGMNPENSNGWLFERREMPEYPQD